MKRVELFNGKYPMPYITKLQSKDPRAYREIQKMYDAMWNAYLVKGTKGSISLPYWAQRIKSPKLMNIALKVLSKAGYITVVTQPNRNWSEAKLVEDKILTFVTNEELTSIRKHFKWNKYVLNLNDNIDVDKCAIATKINGNIKNTGHNMKGFAKASQTEFKFDTNMMKKYYNEIVKLINFGIEKTIQEYPLLAKDLANYSEIGKEVVDTYINCPARYNAGGRKSDSRGRDISNMLNKIGNPITYKITRSLLVIPYEKRQKATREGLKAKYLFIAELAGYKVGNIFGKIKYGIKCYENWFQHKLDLNNEHDLKELPENIWLERLYMDIDNYYMSPLNYKWSVPIELDMSASILGFYGILLNHKPYMKRTNMLGTNLNDAWGHDTIKNRLQYKSAVMRRLYGSMQSPKDIWIDMNISYNPDDNAQVLKDLTIGEMSVANEFKDFLINNAQMKPKMTVEVWGNKFEIECNKFYNQGEKTITYDLFDSYSNSIKRIHHTNTVKIPNLNAFRRYVATCLIHHLDARCMNTVCNEVYSQSKWIIPIHDAAIVDCEDAKLVRNTYSKQIESIHFNRKDILQTYIRSINIPASTKKEWKDIVSKVEPLESDFKCSEMILK